MSDLQWSVSKQLYFRVVPRLDGTFKREYIQPQAPSSTSPTANPPYSTQHTYSPPQSSSVPRTPQTYDFNTLGSQQSSDTYSRTNPSSYRYNPNPYAVSSNPSSTTTYQAQSTHAQTSSIYPPPRPNPANSYIQNAPMNIPANNYAPHGSPNESYMQNPPMNIPAHSYASHGSPTNPYMQNTQTFSASGGQNTTAGHSTGPPAPQGRGRSAHQVNRKGDTISGPDSTAPPSSLDASYVLRDKAFFTPGRMFSLLFTESFGATATRYNDSVSRVKFGEHVYTNIRRFIVVRAKYEFAYACPVFTYEGRATTKPGVRPEEHAVVYTVGYQPTLIPGETGITKDPIGVETARDVEPLNRASRIYFGIHHPIQYNVKVKDLGIVQADDIFKVVGYYQEESRKP